MAEICHNIKWALICPWSYVVIHPNGYTVLVDRYEWNRLAEAKERAYEENQKTDAYLHRVYGPFWRPYIDSKIC